MTEQGSASLAVECLLRRETIFSMEMLFLAIGVLVGHSAACVDLILYRHTTTND